MQCKAEKNIIRECQKAQNFYFLQIIKIIVTHILGNQQQTFNA